MLIFGLCLSGNPKWISRIVSLLEANFRSLLFILGLDAHIGLLLETMLEAYVLTHVRPMQIIVSTNTIRTPIFYHVNSKHEVNNAKST